MTHGKNLTSTLWQSFMPRRKEIKEQIKNELISMTVYSESFDFSRFDPNAEFEKWAAVEVSDFAAIPDNMEIYTLAGGLYAVFDYIGLSSDPKIFQYIFATWLPNSNYFIDTRPHFEILGEKYKNNDPDSEEEIWIPVKHKVKGPSSH